MAEQQQRPALGEAGMDAARERVCDAHELRLRDVRVTSAQLLRLLAWAPRDADDPDSVRLRAIVLANVEVIGRLVLADVVCDRLELRATAFARRLDVQRLRVRGDTKIAGASFGYSRWAASFEGEVSLSETTFGALRLDESTFAGRVEIHASRFTDLTRLGARFEGPLVLGNSTFEDPVIARGARFEGDLRIVGCRFAGSASFTDATCSSGVDLESVTFEEQSRFVGASFRGDAAFIGVRFGGRADFERTVFHGDARFDGTTFGADASFEEAAFLAAGSFAGVRFERETAFRSATFAVQASFARARFEQSRQLGPLLADDACFEAATFAQPIRVELCARTLSLAHALFLQGGDLLVSWASVVLDGASFSGPSLLTERWGFECPCDEQGWCCDTVRQQIPIPPFLMSMHGAKVAGLTVSGVDLRACAS